MKKLENDFLEKWQGTSRHSANYLKRFLWVRYVDMFWGHYSDVKLKYQEISYKNIFILWSQFCNPTFANKKRRLLLFARWELSLVKFYVEKSIWIEKFKCNWLRQDTWNMLILALPFLIRSLFHYVFYLRVDPLSSLCFLLPNFLTYTSTKNFLSLTFTIHLYMIILWLLISSSVWSILVNTIRVF